ARGDVLVVSIFVNPAQFSPSEDLKKYPRNLAGDLEKLNEVGADVVFTPTAEEIYPEEFQTYVEVKELQEHLCGLFRPGHFSGVATVVLKLFNIVKPHIAFFGEKDYQQLKIIQRMVKDLNLEVEIIGFPIIRDENGLALSSRNSYLATDENKRVLSISRALREIKKEFDRGNRDTKAIIEIGEKTLRKVGINDIDYLEICNPETLKRKELAEGGDLVALAVRLGGARLIDNITL
ncbi:MAG: pantoate--beta-alanine ligase, partial [Thermodesulfobacteriota bacterium]